MGAIALLKTASNSQLAEQNRRQQQALQQQQSQPIVLNLAAHIKRAWDAAKMAKQPIERQMLMNLRQRNGEYDPDKLAEIRAQGGSEIFMMVTSAKCRAAESWLLDILGAEDAWSMERTPLADLPAPVKDAVLQQLYMEAMAAGWKIEEQAFDERLQFLKRRAEQKINDIADRIAERHTLKIKDQLAEGGWEGAFTEVIQDFVTLKACFVKGPVVRKKKRLTWAPGPNGQWLPVVKEELVPVTERRSPFDIYPSPGMIDIQNGDLIDRYRFKRKDLAELFGVPGYSEEALAMILSTYGDKGNMEWLWGDQQLANLQNRVYERYDPSGTIDCINYWGSASGKMLNEWDSRKDLSGGEGFDVNAEYQIEAWQCGPWIFKVMLNPDPLGRKPYSKACYEETPGAFWGNGLPEIVRDAQDVCNATARALCNNMAIASGPQAEIDVERLPPGEKVTQMYPWKLWQVTTDLTGNNQPAIRFFQPNTHAQELLMVYDRFERIADSVSGIPNYTYGDARTGGAGRTASGLGMLMGNASKGIKRVVSNVDRGIQRPTITRYFDHNMQHDPDPTIKGDLRCVAKGAVALMAKEQMQARRTELLQATMNPLDAQILGADGRRELLYETIKAADLPVDRILPDKYQLELRMANAPQPHELAGGGGGGPGGGGSPGIAGSPQSSPAGGSPAAPKTLDAGGQPMGQGPAAAGPPQPQSFADGGLVLHMHMPHQPKSRMVARKQVDGSIAFEPEDGYA